MTWLASPALAVSLWGRLWTVDPFRHALLAGTAIALLCGVLSVFVVSKRMAFIGQGISHAAFGGAGLALLAGLFVPWLRTPHGRDLVIAVFCVATALVIGGLTRRGRVSEDSAIGITLVVAMALGILLLDLRSEVFEYLLRRGRIDPRLGGRAPFHDLLFGSLITVSRSDVWLAWGVTVVVLGAVALFYKELLFFAFDSEGATVFGVPAAAVHYGLLVALAVTIMLAVRMMGVILAGAFLVLPATIALRWSRRMRPVLIISASVAVGSLIPGIAVSVQANLTVGPVIVLVLCVVLAASYALNGLRRRRSR